MQKIVIKNFGAIEYAEIEIKKVLVLIGEQASGKSTIAKLIYLFKNLNNKERFYGYNSVPENIKIIHDDIDSDFTNSTIDNFCDYFGLAQSLPNFEITLYYNFFEKKYLQFSLDNSKNINLTYSSNFFDKNVKSDLKTYANLINKFYQKK